MRLTLPLAIHKRSQINKKKQMSIDEIIESQKKIDICKLYPYN